MDVVLSYCILEGCVDTAGKSEDNSGAVKKTSIVCPPVSINDYHLLAHLPPAAAGSGVEDYNVLQKDEVCWPSEAGEKGIFHSGRRDPSSNGTASSAGLHVYEYPKDQYQQLTSAESGSVCDKSMSMANNALYGNMRIMSPV